MDDSDPLIDSRLRHRGVGDTGGSRSASVGVRSRYRLYWWPGSTGAYRISAAYGGLGGNGDAPYGPDPASSGSRTEVKLPKTRMAPVERVVLVSCLLIALFWAVLQTLVQAVAH